MKSQFSYFVTRLLFFCSISSALLLPSIALAKGYQDCPECPKMVSIPAGAIQTSAWDKQRRVWETFTVAIPTISIAQTEVTQAQWRALMGQVPNSSNNCDNCPVTGISWNDAERYIAKLNEKTGRIYRLPSTTEWEYACRANRSGQKYKDYRYCGSDDVANSAWYSSNSNGTAHPVGAKQANPFGVFDMSGNVWEFVDDCQADPRFFPSDGSPSYSGDCNKRGIRGGSYLSPAMDTYWNSEKFVGATHSREDIGFRVVSSNAGTRSATGTTKPSKPPSSSVGRGMFEL